MSKQYTLSHSEVQQLLAERGHRESYKMKGHSFSLLKGVGKQYCRCCGLVALNNAATQWAVDKGCNYEDHPQFRSVMKRLTKRQW